ncbi:sigma-like protein [Streptomyces sp. MBT49]|uniref:sigma-like protein n=1 Tax=Streptomyces sp. MBT49 TaxID=1488380 RepID=UPI00190B6C79|nr:sigma-like protein [Streptomyces sp. MBT49]MBK3625105.1 sigma-like protein [Streptomyces sp. MBT49]
MSSTEKQSPDITTLENHSPVPPVLKDTVTQGPTTPATSTTPAAPAEDEITTLENHSPAPPVLGLGGGK